jgi:integrase
VLPRLFLGRSFLALSGEQPTLCPPVGPPLRRHSAGQCVCIGANTLWGEAPATADLIAQMIALCPDSMIGKRVRALLCLGFAGAFRRSELCALEVADLVEVPDGLRVLIRRSKGDQEGLGQEVAIPRGYRSGRSRRCRRAGRRRDQQRAGVPASRPRRQGRHRGAVAPCGVHW